jgi:hypothetical protein
MLNAMRILLCFACSAMILRLAGGTHPPGRTAFTTPIGRPWCWRHQRRHVGVILNPPTAAASSLFPSTTVEEGPRAGALRRPARAARWWPQKTTRARQWLGDADEERHGVPRQYHRPDHRA